MTRMLAGRNALITGANAGLGLAIAKRLAAAGCNVMLNGLAPEDEVAADLAAMQEGGVRARYRHADIADRAALQALLQEAADPGGIDILVNNAAIRHFGNVEDLTVEGWDLEFGVNLHSAFLAARFVLPGMRARNWGRIINMASVYGLMGAAGRAGYVTTKHALVGLTRAIALETVRTGITCNALCPATVLTPQMEARLQAEMAKSGKPRPEAEEAFLSTRQPSRRFVDADHVAAMALLLCGPEGESITGATLPIDGAWSVS